VLWTPNKLGLAGAPADPERLSKRLASLAATAERRPLSTRSCVLQNLQFILEGCVAGTAPAACTGSYDITLHGLNSCPADFTGRVAHTGADITKASFPPLI
jgi:hypothetical protein